MPLSDSIMSVSRRTILIIHPGGLGDVLLSLEALASMRARAPHHEFVLLAGSDVGHLLVQCGVIEHLWAIESGVLGALFAGVVELSAAQIGVLRRCDQVVGWLSDETGALRRTLQECGVTRVILQSPTSTAGVHQSDRFLQTVQGESLAEARSPFRLQLPAQVIQSGVNLLRDMGVSRTMPLVICHPGSGSRDKCVRVETWSQLMRGCRDRQRIPAVVLGPADEQVSMAIEAQRVPELPILRPRSVTMLAAILMQARTFIGHDSGVAHLAAALGVSTIAMFGPTDEQRWAPRGSHVTVVRGGNCQCKDWDAVRVCTEKSCLDIKPQTIFEVLDRIDFRYHRVTNS